MRGIIMKRIGLLLIILCLTLTGCKKMNEKDVLKEIQKDFDKSKGYELSGDLSVHNHEEVYQYRVKVSYLKDHYYKVELTNTANNHNQIILKNDDGVYVLTPSLNKSFRFQSDWPYENSQIYLLDAILRDLERDEKTVIEKKEDSYIFQSSVNYPNNSRFITEKVVFSKDLKLKKVKVYDSSGIEVMSMTFDSMKYSPNLKKQDFNIEQYIKEETEEQTEESGVLEDIIYPLYVPEGTKLISEEKIAKTNGERVMMNYDGEKSFLLVEETSDVFQEFTIIPSFGEPYFLMDTLGVMTENSLSWSSNGMDYYLVSDVMSTEELIEVAESITGIISMK